MSVYEAYRDELFEEASRQGAEAAETYYVSGESFRAGVLKQELDSYSVSATHGLSLRVKAGGRTGYAYTERLEDAKELLSRAMDNALCVENDDEQPMTPGGLTYERLESYSPSINNETEKQKIELAMELEHKTLAVDERVARVQSCAIATGSAATRIDNTLGLSVSFKSSMAIAYVVPIAVVGDDARDGFAFRAGRDLGALSFDMLTKQAVAEALAQFGAASYPSGAANVVLRNDAAASLLSAFCGIFSAERAQKGLSLLNGKEGDKIGGDIVSITDDPLMSGGYASAPFDAEGTPTRRVPIVERGTLKTLLHNLKTAKKAGTLTTGHAGKGSAASPIDIAPSNFFIEKGEGNAQALIGQLGDGLFITDLSGLHAGVNAISGDFSLLARGIEIKNGRCARPVDQVTIAGNFFELLKSISAIGDDLFFGLPGGGGCAGSPSLLCTNVMVGGV